MDMPAPDPAAKVVSVHEDISLMDFFLCLIGLVLVVEGLPYFAFPEKMKKWMTAVQEIPDGYLRVLGFLSMGLGLLLVHLFRPK
jgi:uncharacterized protein YjeT (DUF2065 family)